MAFSTITRTSPRASPIIRELGPVIGVAFDGLGYGADATLWGGEFLIADLRGFTRAGYLEPVPMPGGTAAIRQPWRMALSYLEAIFGAHMPADLGIFQRNRRYWNGGRQRFAPG